MSGIWPDKTKCVVLLSFDFDDTSFLHYNNPDAAKSATALSQGEFGPSFRILELPVSWASLNAPYYAFSMGGGSMNTPGDVYRAWEWEFDGSYQYGTAPLSLRCTCRVLEG